MQNRVHLEIKLIKLAVVLDQKGREVKPISKEKIFAQTKDQRVIKTVWLSA